MTHLPPTPTSPQGQASGLASFASRAPAGLPGAGAAPTAAAPRPFSASMLAVLAALQGGARLTGAELCQAAHLPRRTVYEALRRLRERGVLRQRGSLHDSRQTYFWLAEAAPALAPGGASGSPEPAVSAP